jgi:hypothetical protein
MTLAEASGRGFSSTAPVNQKKAHIRHDLSLTTEARADLVSDTWLVFSAASTPLDTGITVAAAVSFLEIAPTPGGT